MYVGRLTSILGFILAMNVHALRSDLYPVDWSLGFNFNGVKLQDYSFAGYKNSNSELPNWNEITSAKFFVNSYGGDPTGQSLSDDAIQAAIDAALANGEGAVIFGPGTYKVSRKFTINKSKIVIVGTRNVQDSEFTDNITKVITDYTSLPGNMPEGIDGGYAIFNFNGGNNQTNEKSLAEDIEPDDLEIKLNSVDGYSVGDEIVIIRDVTNQFINDWGSGSYWGLMVGEKKTIERRHVVSINGPAKKLVLNAPVRHFLKAENGSVKKVTNYLFDIGMFNLKFNTAFVTIGTAENLVGNRHYIASFRNAKNVVVSNIKTFDRVGDATNKHLGDSGMRFINVWDSTISEIDFASTQNRLKKGHGYGLDMIDISHMLIHGSIIQYMRHSYVFNGNNPGKEGNAIVSSTSRGSRAKNCSNANGNGGICVTIKAAGIDCHGSASVGMLFTDITADDRIECKNRKNSSNSNGNTWGAGQTGSLITLWNARGDAKVRFKGMKFHRQGYGWYFGHMIGTGPGFGMKGDNDWREHKGDASSLQPQNLFCDQLSRRQSGGSCDLALPILTGLTEDQEQCVDLQHQIDLLNIQIANLQQQINDINDQDPNGPIFGGGNSILMTNLLNNLNQKTQERDNLQNQYDTMNGVGCDQILIDGLVGPGDDDEIQVVDDDKKDIRLIEDSKEKMIEESKIILSESEKEKVQYVGDYRVNIDGEEEIVEMIIEKRDPKTGELMELDSGYDAKSDPMVKKLVDEFMK